MAPEKGNDDENLHSLHKSSESDDAALEPKKPSGCGKLPPPLQRIIDQADEDESIYEDFWAQKSTESNESVVRYAAYASRLRTFLHSMQRYVAYTSDLSGSLRPLERPGLTRGAYVVSWSYVLGDAAREARKAYRCNHELVHPRFHQSSVREQDNVNETQVTEDFRGTKPGITPALEDHKTVAAQRIFFHGVASMALPAFTLRHIVKYTNSAMKSVKSKALRAGGPLVFCLSVMPFFPSVFDKPVEEAVEWVFYKGFQAFGGQDAVGDAPQIGRSKQLHFRDAALKWSELQVHVSQ